MALDRLYALPNVRSYMDAIHSLDSDQCSSLGILAADILDLATVKQQKGYEFGSRFLVRKAKTMMKCTGICQTPEEQGEWGSMIRTRYFQSKFAQKGHFTIYL